MENQRGVFDEFHTAPYTAVKLWKGHHKSSPYESCPLYSKSFDVIWKLAVCKKWTKFLILFQKTNKKNTACVLRTVNNSCLAPDILYLTWKVLKDVWQDVILVLLMYYYSI